MLGLARYFTSEKGDVSCGVLITILVLAPRPNMSSA